MRETVESPEDKENIRECIRGIPLCDIMKNIIDQSGLTDINLYSFEYIAASCLNIAKTKCSKDEVEKLKKTVIEIIVRRHAEYFRNKNKGDPCSSTTVLIDEIKDSLCRLGYSIWRIDIVLKYRGNIGVSSGFGRLLFEWGISFDPYLNVPYIPASTIKGAVRSMFMQLCIKEKEDRSLCEEKANKLFGSTGEGAGLVMFTDAYPTDAGENGYLLIPDVTNPHYNDEEIKYEIDVAPKPIVHLAINKGTEFSFLMYIMESRGKRRVDYNEDLTMDPERIIYSKDLKLLDKALLLSLGLGLGAKTNTGYTHFYIDRYKKEMCSNR